MAIESPADNRTQEPSSIMVGYAGPLRQNRLTVLTRLILAIPHFIGLLAAVIATVIVIVGGWFGALFRREPATPARRRRKRLTGRPPGRNRVRSHPVRHPHPTL